MPSKTIGKIDSKSGGIIEYARPSVNGRLDPVQIESDPAELDVRMRTPKPGDVIDQSGRDDYPFGKGWDGRPRLWGRVSSGPSNRDGVPALISVCAGGASVFMDEGGVSISGGPFEGIHLVDLEPTGETIPVGFWNWADNFMGAGKGVGFMLERPVFRLVSIEDCQKNRIEHIETGGTLRLRDDWPYEWRATFEDWYMLRRYRVQYDSSSSRDVFELMDEFKFDSFQEMRETMEVYAKLHEWTQVDTVSN